MKITHVEVICLNLPEKEDIVDSSQDAVIVKVHTDEGVVGIGEIDPHPPISQGKPVKAVRQAVGEDIKLMVDAGEQWDASTAIERARKLEVHNPFSLEDPLSPDDIDGYAKLTRATALRIAAGEAETTRFPYRDLMEKEVLT